MEWKQIWWSNKSNLGGNFCCAGESWAVGVVKLADLASVLKTTTKKGGQFFE